MTRFIIIALILILTSCGTKSSENNETDIDLTNIEKKSHFNTTSIGNKIENDTTDIVNYFIVIIDTSQDYSSLHKKMFDINSKLKIPIDTMERFYNKAKNLIALPDNYEDEMYAGEYYPRRDPSKNLSLEYLYVYQKNAKEKTIALVSGIYETEKSADSALSILSKIDKKTFKIKGNIYIGCMH